MKHIVAVLLLLILFNGYFARSQATDATISGIVLDPAGKVIPHAVVTILNEETGVRYTASTNDVGLYVAPTLPPGPYRVQVSKPGFKTLIKPGIILNVQSAVALNFTLPLGAASESITVEGGTSHIETSDASVSTVVDRRFVENIPLNGRSFQDLISMTPGVTTATPQGSSGTGTIGSSGDFSVNGQRTESNNYIVDGVSGNIGAGNGYGIPGAATGGALSASTALGTTQSLVSVDDLQEFRVLSSTYSAEYGGSPGGQFSFQTRSGTDRFHASAFEYLRNSYFDANDWFNDHYGASQAALRQSDFGGTAGGTLRARCANRDACRSFFFISYEGLQLTQPQAASAQLVPDVYLREQAPTLLQPILNAFPLPTSGAIDYGSTENPSLAEFLKSYSVPSELNSASVRLDHTIGSKLALFLRASYSPSSSDTRSLSSLSGIDFATQTYTLGATSQLSNRAENELRVGFARSEAKVTQRLDDFGGAVPIDLAAAVGVGASKNANPFIFLDLAGAGFAELSTSLTRNGLRQWNAVETFSFLKGKHNLKAGIDYRHLSSPYAFASPAVTPLFFSVGDVVGNHPTETSVENTAGVAPQFQEVAAFLQDEWHLRPSLSLSLGLRWELAPAPTGAHGQDAYTISGTLNDPSTLGIASRGTPLWKTPLFNFAPRMGIAWQAHRTPGWETVLRTGGGVFFDTDNQVASSSFSAVGLAASTTYFSVPLPLTPAQANLPIGLTVPYSAVDVFPSHLQLPYALEWNASVEQALGKSQSITLSYVGSDGRRQLEENALNLASVNPDFTYIYSYFGDLTSSYNALQVKFQRSLSRGVQVLSSYSWAHAIDFGSTYTALYVLRGNADFDVRNSFSSAVSWDIPALTHRSVVTPLLNGWGLDGRFIARSAFPVSLEGNEDIDPADGHLYFTGVDLVPNQPLFIHSEQYAGGRSINPAVFSLPSGTGLGNAPRNFVRGFGEGELNLAARREFHPTDFLTVQFRAEGFNLTNHPNFGYVDPYLTDATFGQATKMLNQSLGTVASQYQQGGPRSLQFALRLKF